MSSVVKQVTFTSEHVYAIEFKPS